MGSEFFLCKHLISHMDPADRPFFQACDDSTSIINGLTTLFGTLEQNIPKMVTELLTLNTPKGQESYYIRRNLLKMKHTMSYIKMKKAFDIASYETVQSIIGALLPD